jgi:hypothetical protein
MYKLAPAALAFLNPDLIRCPMSGLYNATNVIVDSLEPGLFRTFMPTGDYKLVMAFINDATDKVYVNIEIHVAFRGTSTYLV